MHRQQNSKGSRKVLPIFSGEKLGDPHPNSKLSHAIEETPDESVRARERKIEREREKEKER